MKVMEEYRRDLSSRLVPDSEIAYNKALIATYNKTANKLHSLNPDYNWTRLRLESLLANIEKELLLLNTEYRVSFKGELPELTHYDNIAAAEEYSFNLQSAGAAVTVNAINKSKIAAVIKTDNLVFSYKTKEGVRKTAISVASVLKSPSVNAVAKIKGLITAGAIAGDNPSKIARDIRREFVTVQKNNIRTVTRTLIAEAFQSAEAEFYAENMDQVSHFKFVATLDTRTTTICRDYDGRNFKEYPSTQYTPPLHPNCRSDIIGISPGYNGKERPINTMTPADKKKARRIKDPHEREEFLKTKIFTIDANLTYRQAEKMYPALKESELISKGTYIKKLGIVL